MRFQPSHQYLFGNIISTRSEQSLGPQFCQPLTDPDDTILGMYFPTSLTDSQIPAGPSLKEKTWHLNWMLLAFLASFRPQRHPIRFIGEIWVMMMMIAFITVKSSLVPLIEGLCAEISVKQPGASSNFYVHMLSHPIFLPEFCVCLITTVTPGNDVLTCKKQTGAINCHVHEHIELPVKLLDYFLRSNKSNINQS